MVFIFSRSEIHETGVASRVGSPGNGDKRTCLTVGRAILVRLARNG